MTEPLLLAVPNVSEGRDPLLVRRIGEAHPGTRPLDVHLDPDHNRSVLTFAHAPRPLLDACFAVASAAIESLDIRRHDGVHPRLGVLDVLPIVPYRADEATAIEAAREIASRLARELHVPVYLYGRASPVGRDLPSVRRRGGQPDLGPAHPHPSAGIVCVGVRGPLVAFNVNLRGPVGAATAIAAAVRERGGGLAGVRALGFQLPSRGLVQVSMNLLDPVRVGPRAAFDRVQLLAAEQQVEVVEAEIVGLVPDPLLEECALLPLRVRARGIDQALRARMGT